MIVLLMFLVIGGIDLCDDPNVRCTLTPSGKVLFEVEAALGDCGYNRFRWDIDQGEDDNIVRTGYGFEVALEPGDHYVVYDFTGNHECEPVAGRAEFVVP